MKSSIGIKDIDELLGLFHQLQRLLKPDLPEKKKELWEQSLDQAKTELVEQLKKRQSVFTPRPGGNIPTRKSSKAKQKEIQQQYERRVIEIAEKKYCEKDPTYAKAVDQAKSKAVDVCKSIDHLLLAIREPLLQFPRVQESLLAVDWKKNIRDYYPFLNKDNFSYQLRETIDVLDALKLQFERQQPKEVESQEELNPAKRWRIIGWIVEGIIALALLLICLYSFGTVTGILVLAALLTIFHYLGWLQPIKAFIYNIMWPK